MFRSLVFSVLFVAPAFAMNTEIKSITFKTSDGAKLQFKVTETNKEKVKDLLEYFQNNSVNKEIKQDNVVSKPEVKSTVEKPKLTPMDNVRIVTIDFLDGKKHPAVSFNRDDTIAKVRTYIKEKKIYLNWYELKYNGQILNDDYRLGNLPREVELYGIGDWQDGY